jgi:hypothetical protein
MKTDERPSTELCTRPAHWESFKPMNPFHIYLYGPDKGAIESSFEDAETRLAQLELLHFEPDGSFVWIHDSGRQQLYGMLYDADGKIQYGEIQGKCHLATWKRLIDAICGVSDQELVVMRLPERRLQDLQSFEADFGSSSM